MTDVLLINCPISFSRKRTTGDERSTPPLGLLYIAANLERNGFSVKVYDVKARGLTIKGLLEEIKKEKPKIIGLSATSLSLRSAVELANSTRKNIDKKEPLIGLGGPHLTFDQDFIRRFPIFDFGVAGEGEETMVQIAKDFSRGKKISGLYLGEIIKDLDNLPFPARHLINKLDYYAANRENLSKEEKLKTIGTSLVGSRGCPFRCIFCSRPVHKTFYRFRSPENIYREMEAIYDDYGGRCSFMDDTLTLNRANVLKLCHFLTKTGKKFRFMAMTRANCVDEEIIKLLAKAGCTDLFFGVESGNARIRNEVIKKNVKDEEILQTVKWCRKYGIQSNLFLMLGFPGEREAEIEDTVNFGRKVQADFIGIHITTLLPGSEIFEIAVKEGRITRDIIDKYARGEEEKISSGEFGVRWPLYIPRGLTLDYLIDAKKRTYRSFYLDPRWMWRRLKHDLTSFESLKQDLRMVKTGVYVFLHGGTKYSIS